jgi:uncharacterized protein DUF4269
MKVLAPFGVRVAGTPPLGLDVPGSDIDVLCFAPDVLVFTDTVASFEAAGATLPLKGDCSRLVAPPCGCVSTLRQQGEKTEPAFAAALVLRGDPYLALLDLAEQEDEILISVLLAGGSGCVATARRNGRAR